MKSADDAIKQCKSARKDVNDQKTVLENLTEYHALLFIMGKPQVLARIQIGTYMNFIVHTCIH